MTCCNMHLPAWQGRFPSGKFVALSVFLRHHPPCSRTHTPAFCTPYAPHVLAPAHTSFLLHVIANQCAHWCGNPRPRRETRQAGCCLGKFVTPYVCALSAAILLCPTAGEADCHVAPLLAMTCRNMHLSAWQGHFPSGKFVALSVFLRHHPPCNRAHLPVFSMSLRASAHTGVAIRVSAGKPDKLAAARANSYQLRICLRYYSLPCAAARRTDCHVASLLAMTCRNMHLSA